MNEIKEGVNAQAPKTVLRRGVSNKTQAVSQLRFHERDAAKNGLFIGCLAEVKVDWSNSADSASFAGIAVPHLTFHFTSMHENVQERRHVYQTIFPVESSVDTIPGGKFDWRVNSVFNWIKHFLDVFYLKGREFTPEEEDALVLPFTDYNEDGSYEPVESETVVNGYRILFDNAAAMFNGSFNLKDGEVAKPCYKTKDGKPIAIWMKLLRYIKNKNEWTPVVRGKNNTGDLGFAGFVGSGAIEIMQPNAAPKVLQLDFSKESITPKEVSKAPNIGTPSTGAPMMGDVSAMGVPQFNNFDNNAAYQDAAMGEGGMPF